MSNKALVLAVGVSFLSFGGCATQDTGPQENYASVPAGSARGDYAAKGPVDGAGAGNELRTPVPGSPVGINRDALEDYRIGPQDLLEISVFGVEELSGSTRVNSRGYISLPLIGEVHAAGLTSQQLEKQLEAELAKEYMQNPDVSVYIKEYTSQQVTVEGAVGRPGAYELKGPTTLLQIIAMASGLASLADPGDVRVFRQESDGTTMMQSFDLTKIRDGAAEDPLIGSSAVIVVQRSKSRAFLRDSLFRDVADLLNPFRYVLP